MEGYELINNWCTPAYSYVEGDKKEHWWADSQNCFYYVICEETDPDTDKRYDGKKYWIIEPHKPEGIVITDKNYEELKSQIKWLVTDTSEESDSGKEWDFDKHGVKE